MLVSLLPSLLFIALTDRPASPPSITVTRESDFGFCVQFSSATTTNATQNVILEDSVMYYTYSKKEWTELCRGLSENLGGKCCKLDFPADDKFTFVSYSKNSYGWGSASDPVTRKSGSSLPPNVPPPLTFGFVTESSIQVQASVSGNQISENDIVYQQQGSEDIVHLCSYNVDEVSYSTHKFDCIVSDLKPATRYIFHHRVRSALGNASTEMLWSSSKFTDEVSESVCSSQSQEFKRASNILLRRNYVVDGSGSYYLRKKKDCYSVSNTECKRGVPRKFEQQVSQRTHLTMTTVLVDSVRSMDAQIKNAKKLDGLTVIIKKPEDILNLKASNLFGILMVYSEDYQLLYRAIDAVENVPDIIGEVYTKGVRGFLLPNRKFNDESNISIAVTRELNSRNMIMDVSLCSPHVINEAALESTQPLVVSKALVPQQHSFAEEERIAAYKMVAQTGGVVCAVPELEAPAASVSDAARNGNSSENSMHITIDKYVAYVDFLRRHLGINHVAVSSGSYIDGDENIVDYNLFAKSRWAAVACRLKAAPYYYHDEDITRIMGRNLRRVYLEILLGRTKQESVASLDKGRVPDTCAPGTVFNSQERKCSPVSCLSKKACPENRICQAFARECVGGEETPDVPCPQFSCCREGEAINEETGLCVPITCAAKRACAKHTVCYNTTTSCSQSQQWCPQFTCCHENAAFNNATNECELPE